MHKYLWVCSVLAVAGLLATRDTAASSDCVAKNVVVCREVGGFGGWPANNGCWVWGDEIVVGFIQGTYRDNPWGHAIDEKQPMVLRFARSLDGGETWQVERPTFLDDKDKEPSLTDCPDGVDFTHPDFAMMLRMVSSKQGFSRFYYSMDRCKTWQGPFRLPEFGRKGIAARTDYIVLGKHDLMAFITASKEDGREGRVFCTRTQDGGKTWDFVSWIGPEPEGFAIMPSTVQIEPGTFLTAIRCQKKPDGWIDAYISEDNGANWRYLNRPVASTGGGNPPSMIKLKDGRLALTYGYRHDPYGIRACLSADNGQTWGEEIILRDDGGCWDLGYPRTVQRADGKIVTMYYFNDQADSERYIAATIWDPDRVVVTAKEPRKRRMKISELQFDGSRLMPDCFGNRKILSGGLYCFKPGETAHPEARHVHDTEEVFIFVQGKGVLPIDGVEYPVETGDVFIVYAGEDHHTRSSVEDPLVAAWYLMEKEEPAQPAK